MKKNNLILAWIFMLHCSIGFAETYDDAIHHRDEALQALKAFNPNSIGRFNANPIEKKLEPQEGRNDLSAQGLDALKSNELANELFTAVHTRDKATYNPNSIELQYAEKILEHPEQVLEEGCYQMPGNCTNRAVTKTCQETLHYTDITCNEALSVAIKTLSSSFIRTVLVSPFQTSITMNLETCSVSESNCGNSNTVNIAPQCEKLAVRASLFNQPLVVTKSPTCQDRTFTVQVFSWSKRPLPLNIEVTQYVSEDSWGKSNCDRVKKEHSVNQCTLVSNNTCTEPNIAKLVNDISLTRACWGREYQFQCTAIQSSSCTPFINQGCSQTASQCTQTFDNRCLVFSQTFSCFDVFCMPEKTICPGKVACADGQCDLTKNEISDDMAEGISRLGALVGVAEEVTTKQINMATPAIFSGSVKGCKKFPLGFRDCCTDTGWGQWVQNCPQDLQDLQRAKHENRVVYLGSYKNHKLGAIHHTYCIFPTQLSTIVQTQGRYGQLNIPFGNAEAPNCRGITPVELQHINFASLDLSPIEQELMSRMVVPNNNAVESVNQSHISRLQKAGQAHD